MWLCGRVGTVSAAGSARRAPAGGSPVGAVGGARTLRRAALGVGGGVPGAGASGGGGMGVGGSGEGGGGIVVGGDRLHLRLSSGRCAG